MTRAELKQIYHLNNELKMWQEELDKVQAEILSSSKLTGEFAEPVGTAVTFGWPGGGEENERHYARKE